MQVVEENSSLLTESAFSQLNNDTKNGAFYYESDLQVDADGAPNAYNPTDTGIDYLANAGTQGIFTINRKRDVTHDLSVIQVLLVIGGV
jgi:hypothetical protein